MLLYRNHQLGIDIKYPYVLCINMYKESLPGTNLCKLLKSPYSEVTLLVPVPQYLIDHSDSLLGYVYRIIVVCIVFIRLKVLIFEG